MKRTALFAVLRTTRLALMFLDFRTFYIRKDSLSDRGRPVRYFSLAMAVCAAVLGEVVFWLAPSDQLLRTICKIVTGVFILLFAFCCRKRNMQAFSMTFAALLLCGAADVLIGVSFIPGVILFALGQICLIILFLKNQMLSAKNWIVWGILSAVFIALILILGSGMGLYVYGAAVYAPVLLLMLVSALKQNQLIKIAGCMFFASDCLLAAYQFWHLHSVIHILYMSLFYAALLLFASFPRSHETGIANSV